MLYIYFFVLLLHTYCIAPLKGCTLNSEIIKLSGYVYIVLGQWEGGILGVDKWGEINRVFEVVL